MAAYPKLSRGLAGETLHEYCQAYGLPDTILHDNASEYLHGDFATICEEKGIKQVYSAPNHPNQNPTEHYMDLIMSMRDVSSISLVSTPPNIGNMPYLTQSVSETDSLFQDAMHPINTSLFGHRPDISHIRIFGCAALAYVEKEKRHKLDFKTEPCIYLGISPRHTHDTHILLRLSTKSIIYRRNVSFNERNDPFLPDSIPLPGL